eukprot:m.328432 g.328432  ORF g.328432 m.328432 type:complete len:141 (+) comp55590_c0_seq37:944-1366(+)
MTSGTPSLVRLPLTQPSRTSGFSATTTTSMICSLSTAKPFHPTWGCTRKELFEVRSCLPSSIFLLSFVFIICLDAMHLPVPLLPVFLFLFLFALFIDAMHLLVPFFPLSLLLRTLSCRIVDVPEATTAERSSLVRFTDAA